MLVRKSTVDGFTFERLSRDVLELTISLFTESLELVCDCCSEEMLMVVPGVLLEGTVYITFGVTMVPQIQIQIIFSQIKKLHNHIK